MKLKRSSLGFLLDGRIKFFLLTLIPCLLYAKDWKPPVAKVASELELFPEPMSAARWLWFQGPVKDHTEAYYRFELDVQEPVKDAHFFTILDDTGDVYFNGRLQKPVPFEQKDVQVHTLHYEIKENWRTGRNLLAFRVKNNYAKGGMILRGEIVLKSGKVLPVVSCNSSAWKATCKKEENFFHLDFDASAWSSPRELGDVLIQPWITVSSVVDHFMTLEEQTAYQKRLNLSSNIDFLNNMEEIKAEIIWNGDSAALSLNGEICPPISYLIGWNPWITNVADITVKARKSGIRLFEYQTGSNRCFIAPGKYDFSSMDKDIRRILALNPNAVLVVALGFDLTGKWLQDNPDEIIGYSTGPADGKDGQFGRFRSPSMASKPFRQEMQRFAKAAVEYMKGKPWYKRVVAIRTSHGIFTEWHYYGMGKAMPDTGKAMTKAFRIHLREKYGNDAALRLAWRKGERLTLNNAEVPGLKERVGYRRFLRNPNEAPDRQVLDYYEFHQQIVANTLLGVAGAIKRVDPRLLVGAYYGYIFCMGYPSVGQTLMLDQVLSSPNIDFLSSPYSYDFVSRIAGGDGLLRMTAETFKRYKKLAFTEIDVRTHVAPPSTLYSCGSTSEETTAVILRDMANAWLSGCGVQFLEFAAVNNQPCWYNDPAILNAWQQSIKVWKEIYESGQFPQQEIAVVVSTDDIIRHGYPEEWRQRPAYEALLDKPLHALKATGCTFDILTLNDYLAEERQYKLVIFLNCFSPSESQREILQTRAQQGTSFFWSYAPGFVTKNGFSDSAMSSLAGVSLKADWRGEALSIICDGKTYSATHPWCGTIKLQPRIISIDKKCNVIGRYTDSGDAAFIFRKRANGSLVFFSGMPLNDIDLWRKVFTIAGIHCYSKDEVMIAGNEKYLLVHVGKEGGYKIKFPRKVVAVKEMFSEEPISIAENGLECILKSDSAKTWLLNISYDVP